MKDIDMETLMIHFKIGLFKLVPLKYLGVTSFLVQLEESRKDSASHGYIDGLLYGMSLLQKYITVMGYVRRDFDGEVHMSKV